MVPWDTGHHTGYGTPRVLSWQQPGAEEREGVVLDHARGPCTGHKGMTEAGASPKVDSEGTVHRLGQWPGALTSVGVN